MRFNSDSALETTPNTDNDTLYPALGYAFIINNPIFPISVVSIDKLNAILPPEMQYPAGEIHGLVTMLGRPVSRPVYVLNQEGERVYISHSNREGHYKAIGLDINQRYVVLALDKPERKYNAAISDYVQPE